MRVLESLPVLGDLLKMELDSRYCRVGAYVAADNVADESLPSSLLGYPVTITEDATTGRKMVTFVVAGGEAGTDGLVLYQGRVGSTVDTLPPHGLAILTRGPAIVNRAAIPTLDYAGATLDVDAIVAALEDRGIITFDEHPETSVQTT